MIEVGEYIKTIYYTIEKVEKIYKEDTYYIVETDQSAYELSWLQHTVLKHSKNIIDLIEVGDYVNGYKVISIDYDVIDDKTECIELDLNNNYQYNLISARQIKTILTKEQMSSIEYKVEE